MKKPELLDGKPVEIQLETVVNQQGEVHRHIFEEMGRIVKINEHYYLRFEESNKNHSPASVTIKIHPQGRVTVIRNAEHTTRLVFDKNQKTVSRYTTPGGLLELDVSTTSLELALKERPFAGYLEVDYQMVAAGDIFGQYQMRLRFTT